ncbi:MULTISPECIES: asparagine synthase (glutamine-hydrolyzing) [Bacillus]|uniref:asparagine synthase (glutamine-hydrolyzing) n=3 Tax=Bacteria TaxID=2 RepID=A0A2G8IYK9_BACPU|nr:asparagine synthase (glutamine-hydrolyzing) [Bacillus pumilus]MCC9087183.1 asparagine synthase (glutamine-hydrolyzing) [Bacillus pumilus]PIK28588.1 asparagine synthase (glutamine-hydrolyzing) [Bacillus pumilus]UUD44199.1 asparagine synthase (glutamine-hydrolyzing) [Bacillus pumilus]
MCGIAGYCHFNQAPLDHHILLNMKNALAVRGPDDSGVYQDESVGLVHTRLSIIDIHSGPQPMTNEDDSIFVILNGEIYNFQELREDLWNKGHTFRTQTDTEVLVHGYEEYGISFIEQLNGMFSAAIWDRKKKVFYLFRDRSGIKPLYFSECRGGLVFGSEMKSLLQHPDIQTVVQPEAVISYLSFRYSIGEQTFFQGIHKLPPGVFLKMDETGITKEAYWQYPLPSDGIDRGEHYYQKALFELLQDSVQKQMMSDVPVGAFLSGGVDSTSIVAFMSKYANDDIHCFSTSFEEKGFSEESYAKLAADQYNVKLHSHRMSEEEYFQLLPEVVKRRDHPLSIPHEVAFYRMSQEAKKHVTVVLCGEGADELFAGYGRVFRSPADWRKILLLQKSRKLSPMLSRLLFDPSFQQQLHQFIHLEDEMDHYKRRYAWFTAGEKGQLLDHQAASFDSSNSHMDQFIAQCFQKMEGQSYENKLLYLFQQIHLPNLLDRLDIMTMSHGLEARVPFLDHRIIQFVNDMPFKYKLPYKGLPSRLQAFFQSSLKTSEVQDIPKYMLKKTMEQTVDKRILYRRKMGFPVPVYHWMSKRMGEIEEKLLDEQSFATELFQRKPLEQFLRNDPNQKNKNGADQKVWMLYNLELWHDHYIKSARLPLPSGR